MIVRHNYLLGLLIKSGNILSSPWSSLFTGCFDFLCVRKYILIVTFSRNRIIFNRQCNIHYLSFYFNLLHTNSKLIVCSLILGAVLLFYFIFWCFYLLYSYLLAEMQSIAEYCPLYCLIVLSYVELCYQCIIDSYFFIQEEELYWANLRYCSESAP